MYERFTDRARKVMSLAIQNAASRHAPAVETEHILLGLLEEGSGVGANVLRNMEVDCSLLSAAAARRCTSYPPPATTSTVNQPSEELPQSFWQATRSAFLRFFAVRGPRLPLTAATRRLVEHAMQEARTLGHNYIGTEHLLLGLLSEPDCTGAQLLTDQGLTLEDVRREVLELLGHA